MISDQAPVFIIAEAGVNHNGDMNLAFKLIDIAKQGGADAIKFQTFKTEEVILENIEKAPYQKVTTGENESQFDMIKKLELTIEDTKKLKNYCSQKGLLFLTTPCDPYSLDLLDELNLPAYKVASADLTNIPFLIKIAKKGKPIILSTGMSFLDEVELALKEIHVHNDRLALLQCTSNYPAKDDEVNLAVMDIYREKFNVIVGYSDHTEGLGAGAYAVARGAKIIEKHFTIDKNMSGPDHRASLEPDELRNYVLEIRRVEKYIGKSDKVPTRAETLTRPSMQKNLVAQDPIRKGDVFTEKNLTAKRTGGRGISPTKYRSLLGQKATRDFLQNEIID